jgi:hypothetical protein
MSIKDSGKTLRSSSINKDPAMLAIHLLKNALKNELTVVSEGKDIFTNFVNSLVYNTITVNDVSSHVHQQINKFYEEFYKLNINEFIVNELIVMFNNIHQDKAAKYWSGIVIDGQSVSIPVGDQSPEEFFKTHPLNGVNSNEGNIMNEENSNTKADDNKVTSDEDLLNSLKKKLEEAHIKNEKLEAELKEANKFKRINDWVAENRPNAVFPIMPKVCGVDFNQIINFGIYYGAKAQEKKAA